MTLTILGNGAGGPFQGRNYTSQLLQVGNQGFIIDCGEGMQHQLYRLRVRHDHVRQIFISHLHGDHVFGLIGLLTSFSLKQRSEPLEVFGTPGLQELVDTHVRICGVRFSFDLRITEVDPTVVALVFDHPLLTVYTVPLHHRTACTGWLFREKVRPRNMQPEKIIEYNIPYTAIPGIKQGADWVQPDGSTVPNAELTLDPPIPRSYAFCSDTAYSDAVAEAVQGVSLLYHEATFTNEHTAEAAFSFHSTAAQAATIAANARVGQLLMGHFSARYKDTTQHLAEARAIFPESYASEEGETYMVF
jgi:ribonuclease Z